MSTVNHLQKQTQAERDRQILQMMPEVHRIARRIHRRLPKHVCLEDLVHAGVLGLLDAANRFDAARPVPLKFYAAHRISGAILDSLRQLDWAPRRLRKWARRIDAAEADLQATLGRSPTEVELAQTLGLTLKELQQLLGEIAGLEISPLNGATDDAPGGEERTQPACATEDSPFQTCARREISGLLESAIHQLPPKQRDILSLYYYEGKTLKEVGAGIGVSESRVSQLHTSAIVTLRSRMQTLFTAPRCAEEKPATPAVSREVTREAGPPRQWWVGTMTLPSPARDGGVLDLQS